MGATLARAAIFRDEWPSQELSMRAITTLLILAAGLFAQAPTQSTPKIQTLIISGRNAHDWRTVDPLLRKALEDTGRFEVRVMEEFRGAGPETLAPYDLIVLNYSDWRKTGLRFGDRADAALLDFVKSGKGLVLYHFSASAFDGWTEFEKLSAHLGGFLAGLVQGALLARVSQTTLEKRAPNLAVLGALLGLILYTWMRAIKTGFP